MAHLFHNTQSYAVKLKSSVLINPHRVVFVAGNNLLELIFLHESFCNTFWCTSKQMIKSGRECVREEYDE